MSILGIFHMALNGIRFQGPGLDPAKQPVQKSSGISGARGGSPVKAEPAFSGVLPKLDGLDLFGAKGTSALNNAQQNLGDLKGRVGTRLSFLA